MAEFPALPLWTDAYLADCSHLSDAEHGRYMMILMVMWRTPNCRLPNDDEWLARKFRRTVGEVRTEIRPLIEEFCECTGNWITQKRLVKEKSRVVTSVKKQSERAKSRWNNNKVPCHGNADTGNAGVALPPEPEPEPIEIYKDDFESWWDLVPKKVSKGQAVKAFRAALKKTDLQTLMDGMQAYAASVAGNDPKFTKHPTTWLNGQCWLDQGLFGSTDEEVAEGREFDRAYAAAKANGPEALAVFIAAQQKKSE